MFGKDIEDYVTESGLSEDTHLKNILITGKGYAWKHILSFENSDFLLAVSWLVKLMSFIQPICLAVIFLIT